MVGAAITGTVVDAATGRPIPDAVIADAGGAVALTDADGRFALSHAGGGRAGVVVTAAGYDDRGLVIRERQVLDDAGRAVTEEQNFLGSLAVYRLGR